METDVIESAIVAAGGFGKYQKWDSKFIEIIFYSRSIITTLTDNVLFCTYSDHKYRLRTLVILTIPLISLTGLWQFPIFYGMSLPHECQEVNSTKTFARHLHENYTDCMMNSTYVSEFEESDWTFSVTSFKYGVISLNKAILRPKVCCSMACVCSQYWRFNWALVLGCMSRHFWQTCLNNHMFDAHFYICYRFVILVFCIWPSIRDIQLFVTCQISRSMGWCPSILCFSSCGSCSEYAQMAWAVIHFLLNWVRHLSLDLISTIFKSLRQK